jgi:hypothetical protein
MWLSTNTRGTWKGYFHQIPGVSQFQPTNIRENQFVGHLLGRSAEYALGANSVGACIARAMRLDQVKRYNKTLNPEFELSKIHSLRVGDSLYTPKTFAVCLDR